MLIFLNNPFPLITHMIKVFIRIALVGCILTQVLLAGALAPRVSKASPDNGDENVDPHLKEIIIIFDQPMSSRGQSIVGGGHSFPLFSGKISWKDSKTLVIPVIS